MTERDSGIEESPSESEESPSEDEPRASSRVAAAVDAVRGRCQPVSRSLDRAWQRSHVGTVLGACERTVSHSRLVRWLTREPDPDVVVIDLMETRTVGPILRAIDYVAGHFETPVRTSTIRQATGRLARSVASNVVPVASAGLLGVVLGTLVVTWDGADPLWLAAHAVAGLAALLGLAVDSSGAALADSRVRERVSLLLAPPAGESCDEERRLDRSR